ncbi:MAG: DJ-1/PfpI family protein [Candidatus Nitronauta litoralis]|uniref:DJ-1/PfpI family protein n=1 Tax=Candidatus Nitronauta litoralis TaxID=2705533 RepID=A0A7T0G1U2_9BACT|nr:MAG: DJ-1/PfpI family protein [Candidatus Nitronauta litoralis]
MAKKVLIPLAPGFEEIETITVVDVLRRAGARVILGGTERGPIKGSRGILVMPDAPLEIQSPKDFDMIVLPGGQPGTTNLENNPGLIHFLKTMNQEQKHIAAICAAPLVLQKAGLIKNKNITSHPSVEKQLKVKGYLDERVVVDGNFTTSRAPGTAMEFALKLVELLYNPEMVEKVNAGMLART